VAASISDFEAYFDAPERTIFLPSDLLEPQFEHSSFLIDGLVSIHPCFDDTIKSSSVVDSFAPGYLGSDLSTNFASPNSTSLHLDTDFGPDFHFDTGDQSHCFDPSFIGNIDFSLDDLVNDPFLFGTAAGLQGDNIPPTLFSAQRLDNDPSLVPSSEIASQFSTPTVDILQAPSRDLTPPISSAISSAIITIECTWPSCSKPFASITEYNHHFKNHSKPFLCELCPARHATKRHLDRHVNECHSNVEKYYCPIASCKRSRIGGRSFPRAENCRRHVVRVHNEEGLDMDDETRRIREARKKGRRASDLTIS